jgi:hypothetical protein
MPRRMPRCESVAQAPPACRRLAARVIGLAIEDAVCPHASVQRQSARRFLRGTRMLGYWCSVAGMDPRRVIDHAAALLHGADSGGDGRLPGGGTRVMGRIRGRRDRR